MRYLYLGIITALLFTVAVVSGPFIARMTQPQVLAEDVVEVDMRPRGETIADMSLLGLEEAQERVPGLIKLPSPSAIPAGFSLVGVSVRPASGPTEWEGKTYYISSATLIYWDRPVTPATRMNTISESGGIIVTINDGPGHNSTEAYERWARPVVVGLPEDEAEEMQREIDLEIAPALEKITIGYLWGNPSVITPDGIIVYDFEKQTAYRIVGNHSTDMLLGILESIIRG